MFYYKPKKKPEKIVFLTDEEKERFYEGNDCSFLYTNLIFPFSFLGDTAANIACKWSASVYFFAGL